MSVAVPIIIFVLAIIVFISAWKRYPMGILYMPTDLRSYGIKVIPTAILTIILVFMIFISRFEHTSVTVSYTIAGMAFLMFSVNLYLMLSERQRQHEIEVANELSNEDVQNEVIQ
ncbi:hypothetical protein EQG49_10035 [Periweissella cryptocerci]|uniref:Uncharacterized protein n=1 Tax=Periweissella cryptocerci TaxID=2506420 RepID=A0A4P6YVF2_9LACO|nr:hypothetical protein [Periweissella cryptocerci]QBO36774.1 hypothetical protein EQG49_10035 [Periweissella cryptocerci]